MIPICAGLNSKRDMQQWIERIDELDFPIFNEKTAIRPEFSLAAISSRFNLPLSFAERSAEHRLAAFLAQMGEISSLSTIRGCAILSSALIYAAELDITTENITPIIHKKFTIEQWESTYFVLTQWIIGSGNGRNCEFVNYIGEKFIKLSNMKINLADDHSGFYFDSGEVSQALDLFENLPDSIV